MFDDDLDKYTLEMVKNEVMALHQGLEKGIQDNPWKEGYLCGRLDAYNDIIKWLDIKKEVSK